MGVTRDTEAQSKRREKILSSSVFSVPSVSLW